MRVLMALTHTKNLVKFGWSICLRPNFSGFLKLWNYPKKWASRIQKSEKVWSQTYTSPKLNQIFCVSLCHQDTHFAWFRRVLAQLVQKLGHFHGFCNLVFNVFNVFISEISTVVHFLVCVFTGKSTYEVYDLGRGFRRIWQHKSVY